MKLWVDDIRNAPDESWTVARTVTSAIKFINQFGEQISVISLDHDISYQVEVLGTSRPYPSPETFEAVAWYILAYYWEAKRVAPELITHSANPVGRKKILDVFHSKLHCSESTQFGVANRLEMEV